MLITDQKELESHCSEIQKESFIAIDSEFMRNKTYYPVPCLLQFAYSKAAFAIDLQNPLNLECVKKIFSNKRIKKVFHSCNQDLEVINLLFKTLPHNIFDTQVAALFLGFDIQPSYEKLVNRFLDIPVDKKMQFSDWEIRPLSDVQIKYAIDDVIHLYKIYQLMLKQIDSLNYKTWIAEEFKNPDQMINSQATPEDTLRKFAYSFREKEKLARCFMILKWREEKAIELNIPKSKVLNDNGIYKSLSVSTLKTPNLELRKILSDDLSKESLEVANNLILQNKKRVKPDPDLLSNLKKLLHRVAIQYNIAPSLIANSDTLTKLASNITKNLKINKGWRKKIFGILALKVIKGETISDLTLDK